MTEPEPLASSRDLQAHEIRLKRLLYRATHRGTQETDRLIGGFVATRLNNFSLAELHALEQIMDLPDVDLADWLSGRLPLPPEHDVPLLRAMRDAAGQ